MMQSLHKVMIFGAGLGLSSQIAAMFPEPKSANQQTAYDLDRLAAAEQRRQKRIERNRSLNREAPPKPVPEWDWQMQEEMERGWLAELKQESAALAVVRGLVRRRVYKDILAYIDDCGGTHSYEIVTKPHGHLQDEEEYAFKRLYIDQYCNGGYTGDSYAGSVCIPLNAGRFLKFHYSM